MTLAPAAKWAAFLGIFAAFCLPAAAADPGLAERLSGGVLRWGGDAEGGAPYQLRDPQDPARVIGFEVELMDALARRLADRMQRPLRAEFEQYDWVSLKLGLLDARDFDCIVSGYELTPENERGVLCTRPYCRYGQQLTIRADESRIESLDDCRGLTVGTLANSAADRLLKKKNFSGIATYDSQVDIYLDLELGRIDAVLLDQPIALYYGASPKLKSVEPLHEPSGYAIALRPDDAELRAELDAALSELMIDGTLRRILTRWRLWGPEQAALAQGPRRAEELAGLGFDPQGHPLDDGFAVEQMPIDMLAHSAQSWTASQYVPLLLRAALKTVWLAVASMAVAVTVGLMIAVARVYGPVPLQWAALAYVEIVRGLPVLFVLFLLYFGLSAYGLDLVADVAAIVGLGLNYAAAEAEVYRSALQAVPVGQMEAARALGMGGVLAFRRVIFPQALRIALGPITTDFVALFKDTSLASVIGVQGDLMKEYLILSRSSLMFVELGALTAALYLAMSLPLGYLSRYLERKFDPASSGQGP